MNNCKHLKCKGKLAPAGRTRMHMLDGGLIEMLVFICTACKNISFEQPSMPSLI